MSWLEYFAYGSNMNSARIKKRLGWEPPRRAASLKGYQMLFDKQSCDGGKANIRRMEGEQVEGVLYRLSEKDLLSLDQFEGVAGGNYAREIVEVLAGEEGNCPATAYVALRTGPEKPPTREYLGHLLAGGEFLSREYLLNLRNQTTLD